jgi:hypothetical protein
MDGLLGSARFRGALTVGYRPWSAGEAGRLSNRVDAMVGQLGSFPVAGAQSGVYRLPPPRSRPTRRRSDRRSTACA